MNKKIIEGFLQLRENSSSAENTLGEEKKGEGRLLSGYSFVTSWRCTLLCVYFKMKNKYHLSLS